MVLLQVRLLCVTGVTVMVWLRGTAMTAVKFWGFIVILRSFFQVSLTSCFVLPWLNFRQCTEEMFLLCSVAGGGASAPTKENDVEENNDLGLGKR